MKWRWNKKGGVIIRVLKKTEKISVLGDGNRICTTKNYKKD